MIFRVPEPQIERIRTLRTVRIDTWRGTWGTDRDRYLTRRNGLITGPDRLTEEGEGSAPVRFYLEEAPLSSERHTP